MGDVLHSRHVRGKGGESLKRWRRYNCWPWPNFLCPGRFLVPTPRIDKQVWEAKKSGESYWQHGNPNRYRRPGADNSRASDDYLHSASRMYHCRGPRRHRYPAPQPRPHRVYCFPWAVLFEKQICRRYDLLAANITRRRDQGITAGRMGILLSRCSLSGWICISMLGYRRCHTISRVGYAVHTGSFRNSCRLLSEVSTPVFGEISGAVTYQYPQWLWMRQYRRPNMYKCGFINSRSHCSEL